jgi:hypothetical protein
MALTNNTTGASIFELGNIVKADSISEVTDILKDAEARVTAQRQEEMQQQRQMQEQQLQAQAQDAQMKAQMLQDEAEKDRQNDITIAEIRAAGYGAAVDINKNEVSDYQDALKNIQQTTQYREQMNMKREEMVSKSSTESQKLQVERERIAAQTQIAKTQLDIAKENKNKYDMKKSKDK